MKMKKRGKISGKRGITGLRMSGLSYCRPPHPHPATYSLFSPPPKHSYFYSACQRIKHMEFAACYHTDILPQAQSSVKVQSLLEERT